MRKVQALKPIQYLTDGEGRRTGVFLDMASWEALLAWIEDATDTQLAVRALGELAAAGGRPEKAGWLRWSEAREDWNDEEGLTEPA